MLNNPVPAILLTPLLSLLDDAGDVGAEELGPEALTQESRSPESLHLLGNKRASVTLIPNEFKNPGVLYKSHRHFSCFSTASFNGEQQLNGGFVEFRNSEHGIKLCAHDGVVCASAVRVINTSVKIAERVNKWEII